MLNLFSIRRLNHNFQQNKLLSRIIPLTADYMVDTPATCFFPNNFSTRKLFKSRMVQVKLRGARNLCKAWLANEYVTFDVCNGDKGVKKSSQAPFF